MRKLAITMALASTALATPALARDKSWYVGVEGGGMLVEDIKFDLGVLRPAPAGSSSLDSHYGFDVDGTIGYDFGAFRVEAETGYRRATVDNVTINGVGGLNATGRTSALSFMLNGMLDFGDDDGIQGFVGGGVGVARVKAGQYRVANAAAVLNDSDTVFAYQGIAGVRAPLGDHVDATVKYRFFTAQDVKLINNVGVNSNFRFRSHSIMGGLTYNFGEPPAPPPPPLPPPPPPPPEPGMAPPPEVVCSPGPYIVFFDWDKSDITPQAASLLDNAISQYQNCGNTQVMLAGHADRSGSPKYNIGLSQRRADSVKAYLTAHAIPDGVISTSAFGESRPRIETADGVRELENRRVEITYGPGSGS